MYLTYFKYCCAYIVPILVLFSLYAGGYFSYTALFTLFIIIPSLELLSPVNTSNMDAVEEAVAAEDRFYDYLLYGLVPCHLLVVAYFLYKIGDPQLPLYETIGMITACGISCGLAINNAHELGHRQTAFEQNLSKLLLWTSLYMHFFIEHNRGHHLNVATEEDPASSRYGESVYAFYIRSIFGAWVSAWELERKRLKRTDTPFISWSNEMLVYQVLQFGLLLAIGLSFGLYVLFCFICCAVIGIVMLETVNYIEHYGLERKRVGKRYERTMPIHSWNSNHPLGRMIMLELSRHSDHHYIANRKYQLLRHFEESPQMPTGYPGMMLLALFPPAWFYVMHRRIAFYNTLLDRADEKTSNMTVTTA